MKTNCVTDINNPNSMNLFGFQSKIGASVSFVLCVLFVFLIGALTISRMSTDVTIFSLKPRDQHVQHNPKPLRFLPLNCSSWNQSSKTCPKTNYPTTHSLHRSSNATCPPHFRWIHEDLKPWKETGITRDMLERGRKTAHFKLIIVDGKAYVETIKKSYLTRDYFTLWGIVQLLRWYPGRLPDLEIIFDCDDRPVVKADEYRGTGVAPPPLFGYCSDQESLDIVFPDWSFWGWPELRIKPWRQTLKEIIEGNKRIKWEDRVPFAYWKGNPWVAPIRLEVFRNCNASNHHNWNSLIYFQDWFKENIVGFKHSKLEDQCTHRYKIYMEGYAWSVSEKYIQACDSPTLYVKSKFHDFYIRGMLPLQHYWPIPDNQTCKSLKFAVEWGNIHFSKSQAMGEASSRYIQEALKMDYVYDYMYHLLNEYAKLLKFKPTVPPNATELCPEALACKADGVYKEYMLDSLEEFPSDSIPCSLPPPYDQHELKAFNDEKIKSIKQVEMWENEYWTGKSVY